MLPTEDSPDGSAPTPLCYVTQAQRSKESPDELAPSPLGYPYESDVSKDPSGADPSTSIMTSFTSTFGPYQSRSKRQRSPRSQLVEGHIPKTRSRSTRGGVSFGSARESASKDITEPFQVWTYWRKENLCFLNNQEEEVKTVPKDWVEQVLDDGNKYFILESLKSGRVFWATTLAKEPRKKRGDKQKAPPAYTPDESQM